MVLHRKVPARRRRWIGIVPVRGWFQSHCLVMNHGEKLFDPTQGIVRTPLLDVALGVPPAPTFGFEPRHVRFGLSFQALRRT